VFGELVACVGTMPPDGFFCGTTGESTLVQAYCTVE
jgi:hypothetical protein